MAYAVVWSEGGGVPHIGRLELAGRVLRVGGGRGHGPAHEVPVEDLSDVRIERRPRARLAGRPTLVLERRDGPALRVVSFEGAGSLYELADRVAAARRTG